MDKVVEDQKGLLGRSLTEKDLLKEIRDNANNSLVGALLEKDVDDNRQLF